MRTKPLNLFFLLILLISGHSYADVLDSTKIAIIKQFVVDARLAYSFKLGVKNTPSVNDDVAFFKRRVEALSEETLANIMAEAYKDRLSFMDAREVAEFYRSKTGQKIVEAQANNLGTQNPYINLTENDKYTYQMFANSEGAKAFSKVGKDPAFFQDLRRLLFDYFSKNQE